MKSIKKYEELQKLIFEFEKEWVNTYKEYPCPKDKNIVPAAKQLIEKWNIG